MIRGRARHPAVIGEDVLVGPHAQVNGARVGDGCFLATGAALFPGSVTGAGSEVRIHGVVQVNTVLPPGTTVPIGWVAVGDPAQIYPPGQHEQIWDIQQTLDFAKEINPHTIQVSLAAPYPGTFLYNQAKENGWLHNEEVDLLTQEGTQIAPLSYPHLSHTEIFDSVETFYKRFYFRTGKIASLVGEMIMSPEMMKRRLREGVEFFQFLRERHQVAS